MLIDPSLDGAALAEKAIELMYARALDSWASEVETLVLPSLTAAADELPPDPEAIDQAQALDAWAPSVEMIVAGAGLIWSYTVIDALIQAGQELPDLAAQDPADEPALKAIDAIGDVYGDDEAVEMLDASRRVDSSPSLRAARAAHLESARESATSVPSSVRDKLVAALRDVEPAEVRVTISTVVKPGSQTFADLASAYTDDAAAAQNDAVVQAAVESGSANLQKVWIATLDSKTRRTHWRADGQRVPLDGRFTIGTEEMRYPCDRRASAAETRNCRCRVGVIEVDDPLPDEGDRHTERLDGRDSTAKNREGTQDDEIARRAAEGDRRARDTASNYSAGGWQAPSEETLNMGPTTAELATDDEEREAPDVETDETEDEGETYRTFTDAIVAVTGEHTSDGRMLAADIDLRFRSMPLPLMWVKQSSMGHLDAFTVGVIESATLTDGKVLASGYLLNSDEATEAAQQIGHGITGPSVDLADTEWVLTDEDGNEISEEEWWDLPMDAKVYQTVTSAELIGTTLVSTPAFGQTSISLNSERETRDVAIVASAAEDFRPRVYEAALFANPQLDGPTPIHMDDSGRIFGHLACFGECHRSIQSECVIAPKTQDNYSQFLTSPPVRLDDGSTLAVGRLTVGTGHADGRLGLRPAAAHYDNTGACFALVNVGEDAHGVWVSGVAAPWATPEQVEMGLSAPLSGDWRAHRGHLELIAALAVNTPGYAVRGTTDTSGRPASLVASLGPVDQETGRPAVMTAEAVADIVRQTIEMTRETERAERRKATADTLLSSVPDTRADERKAEIDGLFAKAGE